MSSEPQGPGWWQASDGKWYAPELAPNAAAPPPPPQAPTPPPVAPPGPGAAPPAPPSGPAPYQAPSSDPTGQRPAAIGDAFNWAWLKYQRNFGDLVLLAIAALVLIGIVVVGGFFLLTATLFSTASSALHCSHDALGNVTDCTTTSGSSLGFFGFLGLVAVLSGLNIFISYLVQMVFIRASLTLGYGQKLEVKKMLSTEGIGTYLVGALLVSIAVLVGSFLCFIPGIVVLFFSPFFGFFIIDKKMSAVDAIKASFQLVNRNLGTMIGFFIASYIAVVLGYLLCGIGEIVALPVVVIATGFMYRRLQGEPVAA